MWAYISKMGKKFQNQYSVQNYWYFRNVFFKYTKSAFVLPPHSKCQFCKQITAQDDNQQMLL